MARLLAVVMSFIAMTPTSAQTCSDAMSKWEVFFGSCMCSEECIGGTGHCKWGGDGGVDRCSGKCEEKCDPTVCGTEACSTAGNDLITNADTVVAGLQNCDDAHFAYAETIKMDSDHLKMAAIDRLTMCGHEVPSMEPSNSVEDSVSNSKPHGCAGQVVISLAVSFSVSNYFSR
eukprot:gnl/TRDRNA2_/TRDRNA2_202835_c0_seq1.p1 gnl/TRDRNA2_/TRDRNA2_202835_c0~~gnl/TRDRNA2_/TRDRNA2_202835_c0_seq1.p1  ORF type:complete len:174 (-),score=21.10 gnl/TRDRNA2_/TRDRNA2_202835_c0_seq1:56-577(-)